MQDITIKIGGMSCQHCVMRVKKALDAVPGVASSEVNIGTAVVRYDELKAKKEDLHAAVEKAGYKVID